MPRRTDVCSVKRWSQAQYHRILGLMTASWAHTLSSSSDGAALRDRLVVCDNCGRWTFKCSRNFLQEQESIRQAGICNLINTPRWTFYSGLHAPVSPLHAVAPSSDRTRADSTSKRVSTGASSSYMPHTIGPNNLCLPHTNPSGAHSELRIWTGGHSSIFVRCGWTCLV